MEDAVRRVVLPAAASGHSSVAEDLVPISPWASCSRSPPAGLESVAALSAVPVLLALGPGSELTSQQLTTLQKEPHAMRI